MTKAPSAIAFAVIGSAVLSTLAPTIGRAETGRRTPFGQAVIGAGSAHVAFIKPDGAAYGWGTNGWGQLGRGDLTPSNVPVRAVGPDGQFLQIAAGPFFTLAIGRNGALMGWGRNDVFQLAQAAGTTVAQPQQITANLWRSVAAGYTHGIGIRQDGQLYTWGTNSSNALCAGNGLPNQAVPVRVGTGSSWMSVAAGDRFNLALDVAGNLWSCGDNTFGQLGLGSNAANVVTLTRVGAATDRWVAISAGGAHAAAIRDDGTLWTWGVNIKGQLGINSTQEKLVPTQVVSPAGPWRAVSAGAMHTLAVRADGSLWAFGLNDDGQLGLGDTIQRNVPTRVGTGRSWQNIAAGFNYSVSLSSRGDLQLWGDGAGGVLGTGNLADRLAPKPTTLTNANPGKLVAGDGTSANIRSNGLLETWGTNAFGQLGNGAPGGFQTTPLSTGTFDWTEISADRDVMLAVRVDGTLWGWGRNANGELGLGHTSQVSVPTVMGTGKQWTKVSTCSGRTIALQADGTMWAWGRNGSFALGDGTTTDRLAAVQIGAGKRWVAIACGSNQTLALTSDGKGHAWGEGSAGVLGILPRGTYATPTEIPHGLQYLAIAAGHNVSTGLTATGDLWSWGAGGCVGDGTAVQRDTRVQIGGPNKYVDLALGTASGLVLRSDGVVRGWGTNGGGQLGDGTATARLAPSSTFFSTPRGLSLKGLTSMVLDTTGARYSSGNGSDGQLGIGPVPGGAAGIVSPAAFGRVW